MRPTDTTRAKRRSAFALCGLVAGMIGLSFASVPLYRMFCQATGFDGTPRIDGAERRPNTISDVRIRVRFDANVNSALPWAFHPVQRQVEVRLGEEALIYYEAENRGTEPVTGTATFNVAPFVAAPYFTKIDCFCFQEQTLAPGQRVQMPVLFYIDPEMTSDVDARDLTNVTLSYTFFRTDLRPGSESEPASDRTATLSERQPVGGVPQG